MSHDKGLLKLLLQTERKLSELETVSRTGMWEFNIFTKEITWSPYMFQIFKRETSLGNPSLEEVRDRIFLMDRFQWELLLNQVSLDGQRRQVELRLLASEDKISWMKKCAQGVYEEQGLVSLRGFCQDITEFKRLQGHYENTKGLLEK